MTGKQKTVNSMVCKKKRGKPVPELETSKNAAAGAPRSLSRRLRCRQKSEHAHQCLESQTLRTTRSMSSHAPLPHHLTIPYHRRLRKHTRTNSPLDPTIPSNPIQ
ncbi:hypothetical protein M758_6G120600 [Ceratodon purpureus]|nr:hypothetical protein M758_6G120600 [Ceratodon purpureus]